MVTYRYQLTLAAKSRFYEVFYITPSLTEIYINQSAKFATAMILSIKQKGFQGSNTSGLPQVRPTEL